ncbi:DUF2076 domain-containing protein [Wolbachia endosymbiont of Ctenocephalides felis wCfeT]|uniref:DUF2076 domain-containing protein n=1 Tax=Wolbachia endosymbiont of Ctenocephalides felis wCfeT TaxID=2732593 RepID=UPI0014486EB6|nr:DUF2076 domain-containing protein [Wolbachia endosymbiont of Ctenocephalides felis wCfeT]
MVKYKGKMECGEKEVDQLTEKLNTANEKVEELEKQLQELQKQLNKEKDNVSVSGSSGYGSISTSNSASTLSSAPSPQLRRPSVTSLESRASSVGKKKGNFLGGALSGVKRMAGGALLHRSLDRRQCIINS